MKHDDFSGILQCVRAFCDAEALLTPLAAGKPLHLAAAVSGGADSMALLRILLALQPEFGFVLSACHVNHGLRGATADRDEAFVRKLCDDWGVPLAAASGDAAARARETGESLEEAARNLRYAFFASLGQAVATAHTADDNLETMLLNFLRGTGLTGLGEAGLPRPAHPLLHATGGSGLSGRAPPPARGRLHKCCG